MSEFDLRQINNSAEQTDNGTASLPSKRRRKKRKGLFRQEVKDMLREATGERCEVCGKPGREIHHNKPRSNGGRGTPENGFVLCPPCHDSADELALRRGILLSDILRLRRSNDPPRVIRRPI